jgi:integrase
MSETSTRSQKIPSYRQKGTLAVVTLPTGLGKRRDVYLGAYGTASSRQEYARVIGEWEAAGRLLIEPIEASGDITVSEIAAAFWRHAKRHYKAGDGKPTSEHWVFRAALKPLKSLYGHTSAANFSPMALKAVRQHFLGWKVSRNTANKYTARVKHVFKWAGAEGLVDPSVFHGLQCVEALKRGRTTARETDPIGPAPEAFVDAIREHTLPEVWAMVELQRLTGMRPGEVCTLRACDLETSGAVWVYRPPAHKMSHRGRDRVICIGPKGQAILKPFLSMSTTEYIFSPQRAMEQRSARLRASRKVPLYPSHLARSNEKLKRKWSLRYKTAAYATAVRRACEAAGVPSWSPNRLRHTRATELRKSFGIEAARVALGHSDANLTAEIYAERDLGLALKIAAECG